MQISPVVSSIFFKQLNSALLARFFFNSLFNSTSIECFWNWRQTKEFARIGHSRFLFPHELLGVGLGAMHLSLHLSTRAKKRNPLYPIQPATCILYLLLFKSEIQDDHQNQYA